MGKTKNILVRVIDWLKLFLADPFWLKKWEEKSYFGKRPDTGRMSVRFIQSKGGSHMYLGDPRMFVEDMSTNIMPFGLRAKDGSEKYPAHLNPASSNKEKIIVAGIDDRYSHFLSDALCTFVRTTAGSILRDGVALYEIVSQKDANGDTESFELQYIQPHYIVRCFGHYYQIIPWWIAKPSRLKVQIIKIPANKILRIDMPVTQGGGRWLRKVLKRLGALSKETVPQFYLKTLESNENISFDFEEYRKNTHLEIAQLTKALGWNQRQRFGNSITEYYSLTRFLRTKRFEAVLRNKVINELNSAIQGSELNLGVVISIGNLFSVEDVTLQEAALSKGNLSLGDMVNKFII